MKKTINKIARFFLQKTCNHNFKEKYVYEGGSDDYIKAKCKDCHFKETRDA